MGAGKMGREHLAAFAACDDAEVVAVVSRGGDSAGKLAGANGVKVHGSDLEAACVSSGATAAVVAASHAESENLVRRCLDLGLHVLAEKPVALDSTATRCLSAQADTAGLVACAAVNRRFYPGLLDGFLRLSTLGPLRHLSLVVSDSPEERRAMGRQPGDVCDRWFIMNTIHAIDLIRMMGGEVVSMTGSLRRPRIDRESIAAHILTDRGLQVAFSLTGGPNLPWSLRLSGESGTLLAEPLEVAHLRLGKEDASYVLGHPEPSGLKMGLMGQARAFLGAIESRKKPFPISDFNDHARTIELCEQLLALPEAP